MTNIGTAFQKDDGSTLFPGDFAPLVMPTSDLISGIAKKGGPNIAPDTITGSIVPFPLLQIDERTTLHTRILVESSADQAHANLLQAQRIAEFQDLFARFDGAPPEHVGILLDRTGTRGAARLIVSIIEGARAFAKGGPDTIFANGILVRFIQLQ